MAFKDKPRAHQPRLGQRAGMSRDDRDPIGNQASFSGVLDDRRELVAERGRLARTPRPPYLYRFTCYDDFQQVPQTKLSVLSELFSSVHDRVPSPYAVNGTDRVAGNGRQQAV